MKISEIAKLTDSKFLVKGDDIEIDNFYVGDFLSRVMGKAPSGCCWLTVMSNVNVAGVASLADIKAVIICEGVEADKLLIDKCSAINVSLLSCKMDIYSAVKLL